MTDTTIYLGGIAIHEPMTVFTDIIITLFCLFFVSKLSGKGKARNAWRKFYAFFAASTFIGAMPHAFFTEHTGTDYKALWLTMQVLNGLAVFYAQFATMLSVMVASPKQKSYYKISTFQLSLFCACVFIFQNFLVVVINNALGLIPVMVLHFTKARRESDKLIGYGIVVSFLTGIVHGAKISLNDHFNYNDIAHVLIMISLSIMYLGIKEENA
jgi:hypothetical protein